MGKWLGGTLQIVAAGLFVVAGDANSVGLLIPAIATGVGGLWIFDRAGRDSASVELPPRTEDREVLKEIDRMQHVLGAMQEELASLSEDRDFYRQLYSGEPAPPTTRGHGRSGS